MHGASFVRFASSVVHRSLHGQGRMLEMLEYPEGQVAARPLRLSSDDLAPMGWPAVGAWFLTARGLFWQAGWTISGLERAIDRLNKAWVLAATPEMLADVGFSEEA
ncbi:MAG: hypothetical protein QOC66_2719 [Pseudonocardiales bacterium]|nr:hypothetical protein [Pseudonocardiales bacterium]